jgi:hypothetical protein
MNRSREVPVHPGGEALAEFTGAGVQVPVKWLGQQNALRRGQADAMDVVDQEQQAGDLLATLLDAELG